ncbi:hypothetical protein NBRC116583_29800 [Arenicella sp. 4NH20-0111]|uniref:cupin-like domain-containing protein n=1 Tax=Arenicella sp. 4NH20-0111 TaxID=3127648 RepID=UPI0031071A08
MGSCSNHALPKLVFEAIKHIDVDRKNSLPVSDFTYRYLQTGTPVVFGDLTHKWAAYHRWDIPYLKRQLSNKLVSVYSNKVGVNGGNSRKPVMNMPANDYFDLLSHDEDDLQIRNLSVGEIAPQIYDDFEYPRLGLKYRHGTGQLSVGGKGSIENMHYRPDIAESFLSNFGDKITVLLVRSEEAKYTYEPPWSFESIVTVDYSAEGLKKHPALSKLNAYIADLAHGDTLYIPSEYRYAVYYHGTSIGLTIAARPTSPSQSLRSRGNQLIVQPLDRLAQSLLGAHWQRRKVRKAVRRSKR